VSVFPAISGSSFRHRACIIRVYTISLLRYPNVMTRHEMRTFLMLLWSFVWGIIEFSRLHKMAVRPK